ncbi:MAG: LysR family transcriptional regulator [Pseudobacteriovorax sp.]|nr:LysR family transcriptional regulator [Pseudobacteriovorax sp.]
MIIIDKIASLGTFTAAAKALKMPSSNLSLKIRQLEEELGHALFTRTTRQVAITEFGKTVLAEAQAVLKAKEKIQALAEKATEEPSGTIRITAPYDVGLYLLRSVIPQFISVFPKTKIEVDLSNEYVDIISGGYDLAIRASMSQLKDSSVMAIKLGETSFGLYVHKQSSFADIKRVEDLQGIPIMSISSAVTLYQNESVFQLNTESQILVRDMMGIKQATIGKAGVGVLPAFHCSDEHSRKSLIELLPDWKAGSALIYAIFPQQASLTPKVRAFVDYLKEEFRL